MPGALSFPFTAQARPGPGTRPRRRARGSAWTGGRWSTWPWPTAELTTDSVVHGGGSGELRVWAEDGRVPCEVRDGGAWTIRGPGADRPPATSAAAAAC